MNSERQALAIKWIGGGKKVSQGRLRSSEPYDIYELNLDHFDLVLKFQEVMAGLNANREIYQLDPVSLIESSLDTNGIVHAAIFRGQVIAYQMLVFPALCPDNLGRDVGLLDSELTKVFHLETIYVLPEYWGHGIQRHLNEFGVECGKILGFRFVGATVSPINYWSLRNILECGLSIRKIRYKYAQNLRYVLWRDLNLDSRIFQMDQIAEVDSKDIVEQSALLDQGWVGRAVNGSAERFNVRYYK